MTDKRSTYDTRLCNITFNMKLKVVNRLLTYRQYEVNVKIKVSRN